MARLDFLCTFGLCARPAVMKSLSLFLFVLLIGGGCHKKSKSSGAAASPVTDSLTRVSYTVQDIAMDTTLFARPERIGELADDRLSESSGIAPSQANPGYLWTEEDSGNPNEIQLINQRGDVVGQCTLAGTTNRDWEDIAVGPGPLPGRPYVYVAEIGDNYLRHPIKTIYRFLEPTVKRGKTPVSETISTIDSIRLTLPGGPKNAEAILLDPATLDLYVLSKENNSTLYKASYPQSLTTPTVMQPLLIIPFGNVTSAAISPDGTAILIRTYHQLYHYSRQPGESIVDALKRPPHQVPLAEEPQGEAIGWATDGSGFYTTSERPFFFSQPLYFYRRR